MQLSRRDLLKAALALPAASRLAGYNALAASSAGKVKITAIKTLQLDNVRDGCLIKIETDAGISGFGEAGASAATARARIALLESRLLGQDPLGIERLFYIMTAPQNPFIPQIGVVSGIDIALWDIAGKILNRPVYQLLGGPFREAVAIYSHGRVKNMLDPAECRDWAQKVRSEPEAFNTFKFGPGTPAAELPPWPQTLDRAELRKVARGFANIREAAGDDIDIAMHCTGQFDLPSAVGLARAIEPIDAAWIEDPLNYVYSEAWVQLKRATRVPVLTGEKVELIAGFKPYLDNGVVDILHPDVAYSGGITGVLKIADYAALTRTPVGLHTGPASLIRFYASVHLGAAIQNFFKIENMLGEFRGFKEKMAAGRPPVVRKGVFAIPEGPGLGLSINEDWLRQNMSKGETYWG